jgi:PAS domain-containing protein
MFKKIKEYFFKLTDKVFPEIKFLIEKIEDNQRVLVKMENLLEEEKQKIEYELCFYKGFAQILIEESPDMVWLKDLEGKYMVANTAIKTGLLFDYHPYGKNDIELSTKAKEKFGSRNHTFGEVCGNSDLVVMDGLKSQRFLESGLIKGKMVYLEVFKFPFYVDGSLVGIGGIGRDMTEYVTAYRQVDCLDCCGNASSLKDIFSRYEFKG